MNDQHQFCWNSRIVVAFIFALAWCSVGSATDQWSNGSADESWDRITRLQGVGRSTRIKSNFVSSCAKSENAVERAAAVCWIARTASVAHVTDLEGLLDDPSPTVSRLAWNALLDLPDAKASTAVLREIETKEELPLVNEYGPGMGDLNEFPSIICQRSLVDRKKWIAGLADRDKWIETFVKERRISNSYQFELKSSAQEATEDLLFSVKPGSNIVFRANVSGPIQTATATESAWPNVNPNAKIVVKDRESLHIELVDSLSDTEEVPPGIYAVSLIPDVMFARTSVGHFQFYVRIKRSVAQELEIEQLLSKPLSSNAVERLGRLRAQRAVPPLIEHFLATTGCEQASAGSALAMIGDARATKAFLQVSNLSCEDSSYSCHSLIQTLDPSAKRVCSEALLEIGTALLDNWEANLSMTDRWLKICSVKLAFYNCERPLRAEQERIGAELISRLVNEARSLSGDERRDHLFMTSEFVIAYVGSESERIIEWFRANKEDPELILAFLREFLWSARMEATGFEYSRRCLQDLEKEVWQWKSSASLNDDQKTKVEKGILKLQNAMCPR